MPDKELRELRCHDCAFSAGTEASKSAITRLKAKLCVDAPAPFSCHVHEGICAGWGEAVVVRAASGYYETLPQWKTTVMQQCLDVIQMNEEKESRGEPITDESVIQDIINVVGNERSSDGR